MERVEDFIVRSYEVDWDGRLLLPVLFNYFEEAAGRHADELGVGLERLKLDGISWVLARMRFELEGLPRELEKVRVRTWPVGVDRLQFRRDFLLLGEQGGVLARAVSQWVVMNLETRRLERFPGFIAELRPENPAQAMPDVKPRNPAQADSPILGHFDVRKSDIDRNRHVNNVRFIGWILESVPEDAGYDRLRGFDIAFKAEARYGDSVLARGQAGQEPGEFLHSLCRISDGQELVRARSLWGN